MRKLSIPVAAALLTMIAAGCGNDGGGAADGGTPAQVEDAGQLGMVRAHEVVSLHLYESGRAAQASKHAGHPTEEIFFSLARTLRTTDAALTAELRQALKEPNDLILDGAPLAKVEGTYAQAWEMLDRAEANLVPDEVRGTSAFHARVIANLVEKVEEEYGEAVEGKRLEKEIEYQDAWGALQEAKRRFVANRADFGEESEEIERQLGVLERALPSLTPAESPASPETVATAADAAIAALAEVGGGETPSIDPVAEAKRTSELLKKAGTEYERGRRSRAAELVAETYVEHFEKLEPALAERDPELMERLEVLIATTLRNEMEAGAPKREVGRLVDNALEQLEEAERLLRRRSG